MQQGLGDLIRFESRQHNLDSDKQVTEVIGIMSIRGVGYVLDETKESAQYRIVRDMENSLRKRLIDDDLVRRIFEIGYSQGALGQDMDVPPAESFFI